MIWRSLDTAILLSLAITILQEVAVLLGQAISHQAADVLATLGAALGDLVMTAAFVAIVAISSLVSLG